MLVHLPAMFEELHLANFIMSCKAKPIKTNITLLNINFNEQLN